MKKLLLLTLISVFSFSAFQLSEATDVTTTSGGTFKHSNTGTTASHAVTLSNTSGVLTTEALTTAGLGAETITVTNTYCTAKSIVFCSVENGSNTQGTVVLGTVTPGAGSFVVVIQNVHATQALNGTLKVRFWFAP